jgi:hypothetical protein
MAEFTVRVELHRANQDDYDTLHSAMEEEGFSRQIKSSGGEWYHLPTAEYNRTSSKTKQEILDSAASPRRPTQPARKTRSL